MATSGFTLKSLAAEIGPARVQQAITEQKDWIPKAHPDICELIRATWNNNPRETIRQSNFIMSFAGFKSYKDMYLLRAYALGKLAPYGIK